MRYKLGMKPSQSALFIFRNISAYVELRNETLLFLNCHIDETNLTQVEYNMR
ncbi:hypothetical protein MKX01_010162, partial [Papaver californicum]